MPGNLIGSIRVTPSAAQPGESVLVEVLSPEGAPVDPSLDVMVNGVRGARQYVQFGDPGTFSISALASDGGIPETAASKVVVSAAAWPDVAAPQGAEPLQLPEAIKRLPLLTAAPVFENRAPYRLQFAANDTTEFSTNLARLFRPDRAATQDSIDAALAITAYHWDFGEGTTLTTRTGLVDHDFSSALAVDEEHRLFDVTCTINTAGAGPFEVKRTLSVVNAYAVCRNRGIIAPPVVFESHACKVLTAFEATLSVQNIEAAPLTLTSRRVSYELGDNEVVGGLETLATPLELRSASLTTLSLTVPFTQVPAAATGIGVVFLGKDAEGRSVHVETHLDVALPDHRTNGLMLRNIAFTRMAALGIDKMLAAQPEETRPRRSRRLQDVRTYREALEVQQATIDEGSLFRATHTGWRALSASARTSIAAAGSTFSGVRDLSPTLHTLTSTGAGRELLLNGVELSQAARDVLHVDDAASPMLRALSDFAIAARLHLPVATEGADCDPDNLPNAEDGWSCQVRQLPDGNDEMIEWHRHAGFVNARKGDLLLAPGGPAGFIGGLLRQVTPPQHYGHIGIMTRNHDMVTHSTFSEERLNDHPNGSISILGLVDEPAPTDGFVPEVLKYGWPGVVTQWVKGAVGPEGKLADTAHMPAPGAPETEIDAVDPDGKVYKIAPFDKYAAASYIGGQWEVVPPLVVKPDPLEETNEVRAKLHAIAEAALAEAGKSHYRFFCYTDAGIGLTLTAPPEAEWAQGTYPSVCSSFIWLLLNRAGVHMEGPGTVALPGDLEPLDVSPGGAEVGDGSLDGLYLYRADERAAAAEWLHEKLKSKVAAGIKEKVKAAADKAGIDLTDQLTGIVGDLIETFSDIGDDVANQMVNAFASDDSSTAAKDSDAWQHLSDSRAVSPDNTLFWDPPSKGGLYGYVVPASYSPGRTEWAPRYVWKYAPTKGTLQGTLRVAGEPKSRGTVQLNDGLTAFTDAHGKYVLPKVPFGVYTAKAQWDQGDGLVVTGSQRLDMRNTDQTFDFDLQRPATSYRTLHVAGDMYFMKYYVVGSNPRGSTPYEFSVDVAPEPGRNTARWTVRQDFHGIYGVGSFLFLLEQDGIVKWNVAWVVSQDASVVEKAADALSSAVEDISLGFVSNLFGHEVNGGDSRSGEIDRNAPAAVDGIRIGPSDGTTGLLNFHIENLGL